MNDFDFDVMQKKRIANNAARMKRGSKSKKCSLPSDHLTPAQWKRRNGPVSTYSLNQPMDWETFKSLPTDIQQSYIDILQSRFNVTASTISKELFGKTGPALKALIEKKGIKYIQMKGKNMSTEEREAWEHWLNPEKHEPEPFPVPSVTEPIKVEEPTVEMLPEEPEIPVEMPEKPEALLEMANKKLDVNTLIDQMFNCPKFEAKEAPKFDLDELSAVFSGEFSPERFLRFVTQLPMPEGNVRIKVEVTKV
jgi:hypothetical protein